MRGFLPHIPSCNWDDRVREQKDSKLPLDLSKQFRLKLVGKHVSEYQASHQGEQSGNETATGFYEMRRSGELKREVSEDLLEKARRLNNKFYPSSLGKQSGDSSKKAMKVCSSLEMLRCGQKQNVLNNLSSSKASLTSSLHGTREVNIQSFLRLKENAFHSKHLSLCDKEEALHKFKQGRPFRSKWFTQLNQNQHR